MESNKENSTLFGALAFSWLAETLCLKFGIPAKVFVTVVTVVNIRTDFL